MLYKLNIDKSKLDENKVEKSDKEENKIEGRPPASDFSDTGSDSGAD